MTVRLTMRELPGAPELDLGVTGWRTVTQRDIDRFAEATGDRQWIHVDPRRAADGPFGATVAHGYYTVALVGSLVPELLVVTDRSMGVNYGIDRLRLTAPVPCGSRIRLRGVLVEATPRASGVLCRVETTVEVEGSERPALVGTMLYLQCG